MEIQTFVSYFLKALLIENKMLFLLKDDLRMNKIGELILKFKSLETVDTRKLQIMKKSFLRKIIIKSQDDEHKRWFVIFVPYNFIFLQKTHRKNDEYKEEEWKRQAAATTMIALAVARK
jgi:hypothetical protein